MLEKAASGRISTNTLMSNSDAKNSSEGGGVAGGVTSVPERSQLEVTVGRAGSLLAAADAFLAPRFDFFTGADLIGFTAAALTSLEPTRASYSFISLLYMSNSRLAIPETNALVSGSMSPNSAQR